MAMALTFKKDPAHLLGGARYAPGKEYVMGREEACLWIRCGLVDLASLRAVDPTPEVLAAHEANLRPGPPLSLREVLTVLSKLPPP